MTQKQSGSGDITFEQDLINEKALGHICMTEGRSFCCIGSCQK